jgi:hypothetical protein
MSETIELACSPLEEDCVQVSSTEEYLPAMKAELKRFQAMLEKRFPIPEGVSARFFIMWQRHEFGRYGEVAIEFISNTKGEDFAYFVESNLPKTWDDPSVYTYAGENDNAN